MMATETGNVPSLASQMREIAGGPFRRKPRGRLLEDHVFDRTVFETAQEPVPLGQTYTLKRVRFDRCTVTTGPFWLSQGWDLEDVVIEKMKAWRIMISAGIPLRNVTITSLAKAGRLEIRPDISTEGQPVRQVDHEDYRLDVSGYKGDVMIDGVNADGVTIDPTRQVKLRLPLETALPLDMPLVPRGSLAHLALGRMVSLRVRDSIHSIRQVFEDPGGSDAPVMAAMREAGILLEP